MGEVRILKDIEMYSWKRLKYRTKAFKYGLTRCDQVFPNTIFLPFLVCWYLRFTIFLIYIN